MNQMGNLEKLGILVIVILVVVVGVVAITPQKTLDSAVFEGGDSAAVPPANIDDPKVDPNAPVAFEAADRGPAFPSADIGTGAGAAHGTDAAGGAGSASGSAGSQMNGSASGGSTPPAGVQPPVPPVTPAAEAGTTEYVVQKGDTGEGISKKTLGRRNGWADIVAVNPGLDARRLKLGQKIRIPARTDAAAPGTGTGTAPTAGSGSGPANQPIGMTPPAQASTPAPAPAADAQKVYVVQPGDMLSDIARRELGSASRWKQLMDANEDVLHGSEVVRPGMKLRIPARTTAVAEGTTVAPARTPVAAGAKTYKVQSGDTLSSIASRLLGSSGRWKEIVKANEGVLHGGTDIRPGMELRIPDDVSAR